MNLTEALKTLKENNYIVEYTYNTVELVYSSVYEKLARALDREGIDYEYMIEWAEDSTPENPKIDEYIKIHDKDVEIWHNKKKGIFNKNKGKFDVLIIGDNDIKSFPDDDPGVVEKIIAYIKTIKV